MKINIYLTFFIQFTVYAFCQYEVIHNTKISLEKLIVIIFVIF